MSTGIDGRLRQGIRYYFNFDANTRKRSTSRATDFAPAPLPDWNKPSEEDKPSRPALFPTMAQTQRARYLKTGAIVAVLLMFVFWLSPSRPQVGGFNRGKLDIPPTTLGKLGLNDVMLEGMHLLWPLSLPNAPNLTTRQSR